MMRADILKSAERASFSSRRIKALFLAMALIILISIAFSPIQGEEAGLSKVIFFVN